MRKLIFLAFALSVFTVMAFAVDNEGDEFIDLKKTWNVEGKQKSTIFSHWAHQDHLEGDCETCHTSMDDLTKLKDLTTGTELDTSVIKGTKNVAHDSFCWSCHSDKKVSIGKNCNKCHVGSKE